MKLRLIAGLMAMVAVVMLGSTAFAWEGRMAGMGDPYGLVEDESDFLINPAKIANEQTIRYYGDYRFGYRDISNWNWGANLSGAIASPLFADTPFTGLGASGKWNASGSEYYNHGQIGAAIPAGPGRFGIFFSYDGKRGDYSGDQALVGTLNTATATSDGISGSASALSNFNMNSEFDNFAVRLMYGMPLGSTFKWGAEVQFRYHDEQDSTANSLRALSVSAIDNTDGSPLFGDLNLNFPVSWNQQNDFYGFLFPYMFPHDSSYWDFQMKTGIEGTMGVAKIGATIRGGTIFAADNKWNYAETISLNNYQPVVDAPVFNAELNNNFAMKGSVEGYNVGGDLWVRYPLSETMSLPFMLRIDYREKERDGFGIGRGSLFFGVDDRVILDPVDAFADFDWDYASKEEFFQVEFGGGVDVIMGSTRIAGGIYYDYTHTKSDLSITVRPDPSLSANIGQVLHDSLFATSSFAGFPDSTEHMFKLRLVGENQLTPELALRGGLEGFVGFVTEDYAYNLGISSAVNVLGVSAPLDGTRWGIIGSIGASYKAGSLVFEPFVQLGYQELSVDGVGATDVVGTLVSAPWNVDRSKDEMLVGAGLSVRF
jgi:hypothetical protein